MAAGLPVEAAGNMQGYVPNSAFTPNTGMNTPAPPAPDLYGYGESLDAASNRAGLLKQLDQLQSELASIDAQIAQIDRDYPGMKNGQAWDIAAKRAEIGDMAAYDNMISSANQAASSSGIAGNLTNVEGKLSLLKSDNTEQRDYIKQQASVALTEAREWADRTGGQLPSSYYRVKEALDNAENVGPNANTIAGILWSKKEAKKLTDADRAYAKALHDADPNSVDAPKLREIYDNTKGGTIEDMAKAEARKKAAKAKIKELQKFPVKEQERLFQQLDEKLKADVLEYASWDTTGKRGLTWRNDK
jgi:hypothetical protein